jgi:hypothetical protein
MKSINPLLYSFDERDELSESSNIDKAKYCSYTNTLVIKFSGGNVYLYSALPPSVYRSFCIAESKGRYFFSKIRGVYPYLKLPINNAHSL